MVPLVSNKKRKTCLSAKLTKDAPFSIDLTEETPQRMLQCQQEDNEEEVEEIEEEENDVSNAFDLFKNNNAFKSMLRCVTTNQMHWHND